MRQLRAGAVLGARLGTSQVRIKGRGLHPRGGAALVLALGLVATMAATTSTGANAAATAKHGHDRGMFRQVNLVSDIPGMATLVDPAVKNPWGIAFGSGKDATPLWVNNQFNPASGSGLPADQLTKITLYRGANGVDPISKVPLEVQASSPTGMVFNPTSDFVINQAGTDTPARFLFNENFVDDSGTASEGRITGWSNVPAPALSTTSTDARIDPAFSTGLALVPGHHGARGADRGHRGNDGRGAHLLVVNGFSGDSGVHVFDTHFADVTKPGQFVDTDAAVDGLVAYNVMYLKGKVYVTYFTGPGQGGGAIGVFTRHGRFLKTLVSGDPLNAPWGMAISPGGWNGMGRSLIVGNVDNGMINAFSLGSGRFRGTLKDADGNPFVNIGLWGIAFGNGVIGTPRSLIFAAGIGTSPGSFDEVYEHGLVGLIEPLNRHDEDEDD